MRLPVSRRGILKLLPAAPFAVQEAKKQAEALINTGLVPADNDRLIRPGSWRHSRPRSDDEKTITGRAAAKLIRMLGLPEWKKREIKRDSRYSRLLDPNIAALQSVSTTAKLHIQWKRNESKALDKITQSYIDDEDRDEFLRKHNLDWF
jgi:hypothetical protein